MKSLILLSLLLCTDLMAQVNRKQHKAVEERYGFFFTGHHTHARLPFQFQSNLIIMSVRINDTETLRLIVDTGVSHTIITNRYAFRKYPPVQTRKIKVIGAGDGSTLAASISIGNTMSFGDVRVEHHNLIILDEDLLRLSEYAGMPIDGIIGYELFANFVVTIDFQRLEISLTYPEKYHYRKRNGDRYPIYIQDQKAYIDALSLSDGTQSIPLRVVLDTGAGQALLLDRFRQLNTLTLPHDVVRVPLGRGMNGLIHGELARIPNLFIGRYKLTDILVSFPDSTAFGLKLAGMPERHGNVGCELLRRFRVTFNYPERYLVLKPVKRLMRERFEHDMSGLELQARGEGYHQYFVQNVADRSPAGQAGLQPGDELLIINNSASSTLQVGDIYQVLQGREGNRVTLIVRRNDQVFTVCFFLKRLI